MRAMIWLALLLAAAPADAFAQSLESWADAGLPVKEKLTLWLDASRLGAARKAMGRGELKNEAGLATWPDASGNRLDVRQDAAEAMPRVIGVGKDALVRFDGEDDHFRLTQAGNSLEQFTIFIVASPRRNQGFFRGAFAFNAAGERDYTSGINLDLGPASSRRFEVLNIEGKGFGGAQNLLTAPEPFGKLHVIEVLGSEKEIAVFVDGKPQGKRAREKLAISMEEITVGARFYNNEAAAQKAVGFGAFDVAELIVYGAALSEGDSKSVQEYLTKKHAGMAASMPPDDFAPVVKRLEPVKNAPPVQILVPGFEVAELPLDLTNINNVRCRADGTMVAVAYNGNVWLLRDKDGDGLEESAELFWENKGSIVAPIGAALTPPGYLLEGKPIFGVFVAAKGKVSLILDRDGDDKADEEKVIATGWTPLPVNVDAVGLAVDPTDHSIYFGLGTPDFSNAYQVGADGVAKYRLDGEHGTIQRIAPDFKTRETVCTGVRFSIGMAFDRHGELFVSDQEGATWLPNGNPLDELLHIQKGRHYGFPPRHPKHLPNVIDEPSVFDFGPQHQSTCGLCFNEPVVEGGKHFGPEAWRGDAITAGESRGKIYRTTLSKSDAGYVAKTQLIACLSMLTIDQCVTRDGDLLVACHSGGPDWGSGPAGKGKLFKIRYIERAHPQPLFAWPAGPNEVRVEFDRAVKPEMLRDVLSTAKLTAGAYVRAGDRFETIWPGYAVVEAQKDAPRREMMIHSAQLTPDGRTLILATDRHVSAEHYALSLPGMGRPARGTDEGQKRGQEAAIDLDYDLTGLEVEWRPAGGGEPWRGWLPHVDLEVSRRLTAGSSSHDALWESMKNQVGFLKLRFQLRVDHLLQPATQPGSTLDYALPNEEAAIMVVSNANIRLSLQRKDRKNPRTLQNKWGKYETAIEIGPNDEKVIACDLSTFCGGDKVLSIATSFLTNEDANPRRLPLSRVFMPWANLKPDASTEIQAIARAKELEGGSWARGRKLFHGEEAKCAKCHTVSGQGGAIGPDLSNLIHRDYASVLRDVVQPSFAINPDFASSVYELVDGRVVTGAARTIDGKLHVGDKDGKVTVFSASEIESVQPSKISIMPEGVIKDLGEEKLRDLMTYLLTPPPSMPRDLVEGRPAPRQKSEVLAMLAGAPSPPEAIRPIKIVLVAGPKDHGPGEHDYPAWQKAWTELVGSAEQVEVSTAWEWPNKKQFAEADVLVFFQRGTWNEQRATDLDPYLARGGGAVYIHWAVDGNPNTEEFARRIGLANKQIKFRHGPLDVEFNRAISHPIARNFTRVQMVDESYWQLTGSLRPAQVMATSREDGAPQPIFWTKEEGKGRVFVSIPGHYSWSFDDPAFRILLLRGIAWSAKEPVDRFNDLVWPGAEVAK
jgi:putative heme-binding domain-containing protein